MPDTSSAARCAIRVYREADWDEWMRLTRALFPEYTVAELSSGMREFLERSDAAVFVVERDSGHLGGYVQAGTRPYADGCDTSPVGYIEEWYIDPDLRRAGLGRALLARAEEWARGRGYREMASDALLDNAVSHQAHEAAGYMEVERLVAFRKPL